MNPLEERRGEKEGYDTESNSERRDRKYRGKARRKGIRYDKEEMKKDTHPALPATSPTQCTVFACYDNLFALAQRPRRRNPEMRGGPIKCTNRFGAPGYPFISARRYTPVGVMALG
jgi:hypothetical protein